MSSHKQSELIGKLIPIIRGWCNYQNPWNSSKAFKQLTNLMWNKLWRWGKRRHPNKGRKWISRKYWDLNNKGWRFTFKSEDFVYTLPKHSDFSCAKMWVKVQNVRSPFDGDINYWSKKNSILYDGSTARTLRKQNHSCGHCGLKFLDEEKVELHHIDGNHNNWDSKNLLAIDRSCHHYIHMGKSRED